MGDGYTGERMPWAIDISAGNFGALSAKGIGKGRADEASARGNTAWTALAAWAAVAWAPWAVEVAARLVCRTAA